MDNPSQVRILVVEDDETYRRLVTLILQRAGYTVTATRDFSEAIRVIESPDRLDLLLSDIQLPAGTPHGLSIGRMAKSKRPDLKIIYMSGAFEIDDIDTTTEDARMLQKPFFPATLVKAVESTLGPSLPPASASAA
jgi:CheY-like chemotaxis protein